MPSFRNLLEELPADVARAPRPPTEGPYAKGSGLAAWTLVHIMLTDDPELVSASARITAAKEVADRCEGKSRQAAEGIKDTLTIGDFQLHKLDGNDLAEFKRLCFLAAPEALSAMGVEE